jgi:hypothetical protein
MYVELSGRQTGKTTRLVTEVKKRLLQPQLKGHEIISDWTYVVVAHTDAFAKRIIKEHFSRSEQEWIKGISASRFMDYSRGRSQTSYFFDEFLFYRDPINLREFVQNTDFYFASSLDRSVTLNDFLRHLSGEKPSFLLEILESNGWDYVTHDGDGGIQSNNFLNQTLIKGE